MQLKSTKVAKDSEVVWFQEFLEKNHPLSMIIRAHECVMARALLEMASEVMCWPNWPDTDLLEGALFWAEDGFERFANGKLITVFSATESST